MKALFPYKLVFVTILFLINAFAYAQNRNSCFEIQGISFEAPKSKVTSETFKPIQKIGANWIAIMPYGYTKNGNPDIQFNSFWQWRGEREEGIIESILAARVNNLNVMIKPHLWIHSQFTGDVKFNTEEEWNIWENSYSKYILFYAQLAEKHKVEMFCLGTELKEFVNARPQFWKRLINDVREIYTGKITYAANWDNYDKIPFWKSLDYIGADAYFPLSDSKTPSKYELNMAWEKWWKQIGNLSLKNNIPVIFTEIGYRSIDYCGKEPWVSYENLGEENQQSQMICLESFFDTSKNKKYFKGAFLWKWHCQTHLPGKGNKKYTFQNKKAENVVKNNY